MIKVTLTATAIAAAVSLGTTAIAGGHGNYFADKQITVQVPSGSGGTYHVYCNWCSAISESSFPENPKQLFKICPEVAELSQQGLWQM